MTFMDAFSRSHSPDGDQAADLAGVRDQLLRAGFDDLVPSALLDAPAGLAYRPQACAALNCLLSAQRIANALQNGTDREKTQADALALLVLLDRALDAAGHWVALATERSQRRGASTLGDPKLTARLSLLDAEAGRTVSRSTEWISQVRSTTRAALEGRPPTFGYAGDRLQIRPSPPSGPGVRSVKAALASVPIGQLAGQWTDRLAQVLAAVLRCGAERVASPRGRAELEFDWD